MMMTGGNGADRAKVRECIMANTDQAPASRAKASERNWIDASGKECDADNATGVRYVIPAIGKSLDVQFDSVPRAMQIMGWGFGLHTKMGNVANTVRNGDKANPGSPDDEFDELSDWVANYVGGLWREASEGVRGPKYDDAILADVLAGIAAKAGLDPTGRSAADYLAKLADKKERAKLLAATIAMPDGSEVVVKLAYADEAKARGITKPVASKTASDLL